MTSDTIAHPSQVRSDSNPALTAALAVASDRRRRRWRGRGSFNWCWISSPVRSASSSAMPIIWRVPLGALIALAAGKGAPRTVLMLGIVVLAVAALANAGLGAYHAGVEWGFWKGPTECTGPDDQFRQRRQPAGPSRQGESGALRRSAMALPRDFAGRLQRADLAADGGDRGVGFGEDAAQAGVSSLVVPAKAGDPYSPSSVVSEGLDH